MKYAWILATLAVLAAGAWWWRGRDRPAARAPAPAAAAGIDAGDRAATPPAPAPSLTPAVTPAVAGTPPAVPEPTPPVADGVPFEREVRDPGWAVDQERELTIRLAHVTELVAARGAKVTIAAAECRATLCRIDVAAPGDKDLSALYGALETPEGLYGWADGVVLGQVDTDPATGGRTTQILVAFERELP
ncbi:MAG: hypothetical protein IPL61_34255 [Myxococcales bacterium]|nr:hypothetical protein [Myxococcales bacterium]